MIRQANVKDLVRIAQVHQLCFPDSYSSSLGTDLLKRFYNEYLSGAPELFLVCENPGKEIVGFCMGYYMEKNRYKNAFLKKNLFRIGLRTVVGLIGGDKRVWKKLRSFSNELKWEMMDRSVEEVPLEKKRRSAFHLRPAGIPWEWLCAVHAG